MVWSTITDYMPKYQINGNISTANYARYALGEWETPGWIKAKIESVKPDPMDDINDTGALDDFLKEFKIQPQII